MILPAVRYGAPRIPGNQSPNTSGEDCFGEGLMQKKEFALSFVQPDEIRTSATSSVIRKQDSASIYY